MIEIEITLALICLALGVFLILIKRKNLVDPIAAKKIPIPEAPKEATSEEKALL